MAALALLLFVAPPMTGWGQTKDDPTYKLTQVSTVSAGNKYVFVNDGYAVTTVSTTVNKKNLQSTNSYSTTGLQGNEEYVYELETATNGYYLKNASLSSNQYLNNSSSTDMSMGSKSSIWSINITNNVALISNKSNNDRFLGDAGGTGNSQTHLYKAYATSNLSSHAHDFTVYLLEEETTDPTITLSKTSLTGFHYNEGYGPSASQSFKVSGANLGDNITVSLDENSNYEMSAQDGDNWSTINSIVLPATDGTVGETTLYVRMKSGLTGSEITGTITAASEGATEKSISLSGSVTPTYTLTYSAENGSITGVIGTTAVESGAALVEGTQVALTAEPLEGYRFVEWSVSGTNATLSSTTDNPTTFTMGTADATVTATFEVIPTHTVTFSVNGETTTTDFDEGAAIVFPSDPGDINGMSFMGWVESAIIGTTNVAPSFVTSATMGTSNLTYYAVFAMATSDTPVEMVQTLQYDSWTYGGPTSNKNSYRLFGDGGYVESAAFDLSTLTQVNVYGGTYGGDDNNSLTIGDGVNKWKDVTVSGNSQTKKHEYTSQGAQELQGIKELFVTSNSGNGTGSGVRISKVEIYYTAIPYSYYCTTVPAALPPVITVAENPFVISTTATITCATPGAMIMYGFDNENWENYSTALTINTSTTIYAKAVKDSNESTVSSVVVTKNLAEPTVTIDASGITNTNVYNGTNAGSLSATVTYNQTPIEGATVTWSGNNDEIATIDANTGVVTLVASGSVTFTATYAGNSDYSEKTATYNMTVTNVDPNGSGTRCNPYTVAEARTLIDDLSGGNSSTVYVSGIIYHVASFSSKKITYWISDNGQGNYNDYDGLQVYQGKGINGADFSAQADLEVGDQVIVKGVMSKYSGKYQFNSGNSLSLLVHSNNYSKAIEGYGENAGGYYLVASPVNDQAPTTAMTTGDYDFYYFDQAQTQEWRNYEADNGASHFNLAAGKGYLYANSANTVITVSGTPTTDYTTTLSKTSGAEFEGMNLVGNPLGVNAYIDRPFYIMNSAGTELVVATGIRDYIFPMEGVFVSASTDEEELEFSATAPNSGNTDLVVNVNAGSKMLDRAVVRFNAGGMLPKFQLTPNSTKVYIPQGNKDYAVVRSAAQGEMPVSFKAENNGTYTLSVNAENVEMSYLHLIDNMTGADVDLLQTPSYTFEAKTSDYASRFRLMFSASSISEDADGDNAFAYFNGSNWTINNMGEATLQVVDVMGRVLSSEQINGNAEVSINQPTGVYMLRLLNENNVRVQKIVVR